MKSKALGFILKQSKIILLAVIVLIASLNANNPVENIFTVIMSQAPFMLIYCFGMTLAILTGGLDLSIGSVAAFSSYIAATLIIQGQVVLGIIVGLAIGAAIGMTNGLMISKLKVSPFIATYGMDWVVRGVVLFILAGQKIFGFTEGFTSISKGAVVSFTNTMKISNPFIIAVVIFLVLLFLMRRTTFGRNVYCVGANSKATRITGVNTSRVIIIIYMISGLLAAIAGLMYAAVLNCAEPHMGTQYGLMAIAATLVGGTAISGGKGGVGNTIIGVLIMVFLTNALAVLGISHLWQEAVFGLVIIFAALMEKARQKQIMLLQM
jgi:ribose transport system permease protein